jgi:hypothetical protein
MYNGDLLIPDRSAVWLQLQQANLSEETSIHLVHQGRKPTSQPRRLGNLNHLPMSQTPLVFEVKI